MAAGHFCRLSAFILFAEIRLSHHRVRGVLSLSRSRCTAFACLRPVAPSGFQVDQREFFDWDILQANPNCTYRRG
jgi:hypothetical protein